MRVVFEVQLSCPALNATFLIKAVNAAALTIDCVQFVGGRKYFLGEPLLLTKVSCPTGDIAASIVLDQFSLAVVLTAPVHSVTI